MPSLLGCTFGRSLLAFVRNSGIVCPQHARTPSTWHCVDESGFITCIDRALPVSFNSVRHVHELCLTFQNTWSMQLSSSERRKLREPSHIKALRLQIQSCVVEADRARLLTELHQAKAHVACTLRQIHEVSQFN